MEMLAESGRTMRNSPGRKGEKATQAKGKDGMDKSTGMRKMSVKGFPVCFAVPFCAFCSHVEPSVRPNRSKHLSRNLFLFNEICKLFLI